MRPMLADAGNVFELDDLVELIVAVGVAQTEEAPLEPLNVTYNESKAKSRPWADESLTASRSTVVEALLPIAGGVTR